jgi:ribulose-bisphosphate carboxylase large chain
MNIKDRPFFFGVVKPNIGLSPKAFADIALEAFMGGLDVAKDDEMLSDIPWSPLIERTRLCADAARKAEDATGEKKVFLANVTDEVDRLLELHDSAVKNGAGMVMVNVMTVGLSATRVLCRHSAVPVVAHFDFIAPMTMIPYHGISSALLTKLQRIAGCDAIVMPGFGERMKTQDEEVMANVTACVNELGNIKKSLPIPGGSDWAGTLPDMYERLGSADFGFIPGRGVFGHSMGPRAGAKSLRQAWTLIRDGASIQDGAERFPELKAAIDAFGGA